MPPYHDAARLMMMPDIAGMILRCAMLRASDDAAFASAAVDADDDAADAAIAAADYAAAMPPMLSLMPRLMPAAIAYGADMDSAMPHAYAMLMRAALQDDADMPGCQRRHMPPWRKMPCLWRYCLMIAFAAMPSAPARH